MLFCWLLGAGRSEAADPSPATRVLIVINDDSPVSRTIGEYYARRRAIPSGNLCHVRAAQSEEIPRSEYDRIASQIRNCLISRGLVDSVYYIVTTLGVPLKIIGTPGLGGDAAAVDSELATLYEEIKSGKPHRVQGVLDNPFFRQTSAAFSHPRFPIYLVTRLAAYDFAGVRDMIERALQAANRGNFVIDMGAGGDAGGEKWLKDAAEKLPKSRVILDQTPLPLYDQVDVIAYASWGSNDHSHNRRFPDFRWLPGAIATEFVSTDGRTFMRPPEGWIPSANWTDTKGWFAGSPQALTADFILEGATGASGHVYEPYLGFTPHPDILLPAYYSGRNLAESFYLSIPALSWQNIVVGDPLCSLGPPQ